MARTSDTWPPPEDLPTSSEPPQWPPPAPQPTLPEPLPRPQSQPQPLLQLQSQRQPQPWPQPQTQPRPRLQPQFQRQPQPQLQPWPASEHVPTISSVATTVAPFSAATSGHCRGLSPTLSTSLSHAAHGHYGFPQRRVPVANFHPQQSSAAADGGFHYYSPSVTTTSVNTRQVYSGAGNESSFPVILAKQLKGGAELVVNEEPEVKDKQVVNEGSLVINQKPVISKELETTDPYFNLFPPGWRFCPTDAELVLDYLKPRIENKQLPKNRIKELNIYEHHPANLAAIYEKCGDKEWYFFSPRDRKYKNGNRPARNADGGYWKATGADKEITSKSKGETVVGSRKNLVFHDGKPQHGVKSDWMMHEYQYAEAPRHKRAHENDMKLDDIVLCKIYKKQETNNNNRGRKRRTQHDEEEEGPKDEPKPQQQQPQLLQPQQHQQMQWTPLLQSQLAYPQSPSRLLLRRQPEFFHDQVGYQMYEPRTSISEYGSWFTTTPYASGSNHVFQSSSEHSSGLLEDVVNTVRPGNGNDSSVQPRLAYEDPGTTNANPELRVQIYQETGSMDGTPDEFDIQIDEETGYMNAGPECEDLRNISTDETNVSMDFDYLEDEILDHWNTDHQSQNNPQLQ